MRLKNIISCFVAILACELVGVAGSFVTMPALASWYAGLLRPAFTPPDWVFGPVWTTLFALMGVAAFLVWRKGAHRKDVRRALVIFAIQLALNLLWSVLFFGYHTLLGALIEIIVLWAAIVTTMVAFAKVSRCASLLLLPYVLWVTFAGCLTYSLWALNTAPRNISLFYYNASLDQDAQGNIQCSRQGLTPVSRQLPPTKTPIEDSIRLLLQGQLSSEERAQGTVSMYPLEGLTLQDTNFNKGHLTLTFSDPNAKTSGGSCRAAILWLEIEATAKQFPQVESVTFMPEDIFQP